MTSDTATAYLARPGERLVLEGYRNLQARSHTYDDNYRDAARALFIKTLGEVSGRYTYRVLFDFTKILSKCSSCPLLSGYVGCPHLCRDEVMILGLLSGVQHDEQTTIALCLDQIVCPMRNPEVLAAAEILAATLKVQGKWLLPVPADTIRAIIAEAMPSGTMH